MGCVVISILIALGFLLLFWRDIKLWYYKGQYKHNFIRMYLFGENNRVIEHFTFVKPSMTAVYKSEEYTVDPREVYHIGDIPTLFYRRGNPSPMSFLRAKETDVMINSENLKLVMDQKLIKDLLVEHNLLKIILIVTIVTGVICIAIALKVFDVMSMIKGSTGG
jgi:hypothetical protein